MKKKGQINADFLHKLYECFLACRRNGDVVFDDQFKVREVTFCALVGNLYEATDFLKKLRGQEVRRRHLSRFFAAYKTFLILSGYKKANMCDIWILLDKREFDMCRLAIDLWFDKDQRWSYYLQLYRQTQNPQDAQLARQFSVYDIGGNRLDDLQEISVATKDWSDIDRAHRYYEKNPPLYEVKEASYWAKRYSATNNKVDLSLAIEKAKLLPQRSKDAVEAWSEIYRVFRSPRIRRILDKSKELLRGVPDENFDDCLKLARQTWQREDFDLALSFLDGVDHHEGQEILTRIMESVISSTRFHAQDF